MAKLDDVIAEETAKIEGEVDDNKLDEPTGVEAKTEELDNAGDETDAKDTKDAGTDDTVQNDTTEELEEPFVEETPPVVQDLPADVAEYVNEKLQDVEVWGREGEDGKIQKFSVKSAYDLPEDFIPRSYKDQQIQAQQFAKQDRLISKFEDEYAGVQADNVRAEQQAQLEASWSVELKSAQAEGRIPAVKVEKPGDPGFDKAAEVIEYMRLENEKLAKINAPYRVQSFTQALNLYEANGLKAAQAETQTKEDALQSKKGSMVGSGRATKDQFANLPKSGTKLDDLLAELTY